MLILSLLISLLMGILVVSIFWPKEDTVKYFCFKFWLSLGMGIGITSTTYFFHKLFFGSNFKSILISEILLLLVLSTILFYKRPAFNILKKEKKLSSPNILDKIIPISFFITAFSSFISFVIFSLKNPHGNWDAWLIWNLHARFIYKLNHLTDFFVNSPDWSHPDYPTLIPAAIARSWQYLGHEQLLTPIVIAMLFTFGIVFLLTSSLSILKSKSQGYLAGLIMLSTFTFIQQGASQYADIPIAFFILATLILLSLKDKFNRSTLLILAGITAGLAVWCKNEGLLFILSVSIARFIAVSVKKDFKFALKEFLLFLTGAFPLLAGIVYFKTQLTPANDIFLNQGFNELTSRISSPARYSEIFSQFLFTVKSYFSRLAGLPLLVAYAILIGISIKEEYKTSIITITITICLMLAGYFGIYLITPHDLYWHLSTSLYRLLLQIWPAFLLLCFIIVRSPEEVK